MMKKLILAILYISFALFLTAILLVVRFPKDSFLAYLCAKIEQRASGYACTISDIGYRYPAFFDFGTVTIRKRENGREWMIDNMTVFFDPKTSLQDFQAAFGMYGGSIRIGGYFANGWKEVHLNTVEVFGVDLEKTDLQRRIGRKVSGLVGFTGTCDTRISEIAHGRLKGRVELRSFSGELKRSILMNRDVNFERVRSQIEVDRQQVRFTDGSATGKRYDTSFSGQVRFGPMMSESSFLIDGTLSLKQEFVSQNRQVARAAALLYKKYRNTEIPFNVTGQLQKPIFRFGMRPQ